MTAVDIPTRHNLLKPKIPQHSDTALCWGQLYGSSYALAIASAAAQHTGLVLAVVADGHTALKLEAELDFFIRDRRLDILVFADWETLPYDMFSPHQDIISQRLATLYRLPNRRQGILIVPVATLMQRLAPRTYLDSHAFLLNVGERVQREGIRQRLQAAGYHYVSQVMEHGEFAIRGSLIDLFPMGSESPFRIDLFDNEVETIRIFDPENQRSVAKVSSIELLPAREFSLDKDSITHFRRVFRNAFAGDPQRCSIYRQVSNGIAPAGIEYYLPLFFENTETLFDYLPQNTLVIQLEHATAAMNAFQQQIVERYEQRRHDLERPILSPPQLFLDVAETRAALRAYPNIDLKHGPSNEADINFATRQPPTLDLDNRAEDPTKALKGFLAHFPGRVLCAVESPGRREILLETLRTHGLRPQQCDSWQDFLDANQPALTITIAPLEEGLVLEEPTLAIIAEPQLYGERARQIRRRGQTRDTETVLRNLTDLSIGTPVVHENHGVGRYAGLQRLEAAGMETEFVVIDYADDGKLYVPVSSLHLLSRYTGSSPENAPLHKLGSDQWAKARRKAAKRICDTAAELLDVYARRQARPGHAFGFHDHDYAAFASAFPFEETPDQQSAIEAVVNDMRSDSPMDRIVCGDVGFGKTEVAMRAAFLAVQDGRQVAVLVPTTLLTQQHSQNFQDRFADWPVRVESLSRFRSKKQENQVLTGLRDGTVDIVIGTHKLLQKHTEFKRLGLVIIDEEHRFGVRQKERLKALRTQVDILTLTATPIPRTLNMAMAGLRDLSIIATPPAARLAIKTFVGEWNKTLIQEACQREIKRGGQVYFLHNEVQTIERQAREIQSLMPTAQIAIAHGQMRERELERVMLDFYHQRCNILVCSTIIESGIDVPNANTIIVNRADKLGLAQLHQLRGRVGRSHHRAYAFLIVPHRKAMTFDAVKRIEAIESLEDLGAGFLLANHDLEIRGAGELLGEEQSGQIHEIGFTLYMELLERAVKALKANQAPELDQPLEHGPEIDLRAPALIPDDYLPDVHTRLILYKRIANARDNGDLRELQVEIIDRFGLLPEPVKNLFRITSLKLQAMPIGIRKIDAGPRGGRILFGPEPNIDISKLIGLIQKYGHIYKLDGQDKLRFNKEMQNAEARTQEVETLLETMTA